MTNKPGFYVAKVRGVEGVRGVLRSDGWFIAPELVGGLFLHRPHHVTDLRPLWTADPESDEDARELLGVLRKYHAGFDLHAAVTILRDLANPEPPLVEPNGLGAVVESANGLRRWVYGGDRKWRDEYGTVLGFPQNAPQWPRHGRVLSHGYGCTCGGPDCPGGAS